MTEAMPFLQKAILLSYDPRPFVRGVFRIIGGVFRDKQSFRTLLPLW
jgi:hypothetical protein